MFVHFWNLALDRYFAFLIHTKDLLIKPQKKEIDDCVLCWGWGSGVILKDTRNFWSLIRSEMNSNVLIKMKGSHMAPLL